MAGAVAACVVGMEDNLLAMLSNSCTLKSYLISDPASDSFFTEDRNNLGTYSSSGSLLPFWNACKLIFPPSDFGRPDLKYMKGVVGENVQTDGLLSTGFQTDMDNACSAMIADMIANATPLCSANGDFYETVSVQPLVQMRQMHRKRKKSVTP
jgi:hypothetical protein